MAYQKFGCDLRLLKNLTQQNDRYRGSDLSTAIRPETGLVDLQTVTDVLNLQQALLLRFMTHAGELSILGHPDYGSRLYTLIGELNNDTNRNLVKLYTIEALEAEPRVKEIVSVDVIPDPNIPDIVDVTVSIKAIDSDTPLNLVFPFSFQEGLIP
jgi:phage baseplate assembly protein W